MKRILLFAAVVLLAGSVCAEIQVINGQKFECRDGMCMPVEDDAEASDEAAPSESAPVVSAATNAAPTVGEVVCEGGMCRVVEPPPDDVAASAAPYAVAPRLAHGYMSADTFVAFLENRESVPFQLAGKAWWLVLVIVLFGGLCMNLTPCVLPMVPINLMVIGRSWARGALYGLGIALAYGALGLFAALGGMAFGEIQGSPWFNAAVAVLFLVLALALFGLFFIDFSKKRNSLSSMRESMWPGVFAFFMGVVSAVLAGACVAPILITVLLLTADLVAKGAHIALALPFVFGLGMALPWPFAGAGLQVLPKPGAWMTKVNKVFGVVVLLFAAWYGYLAFKGFAGGRAEPSLAEPGDASVVVVSSPEGFSLAGLRRPVLVDCWASWCKNCTAMERGPLAEPQVKKALERFTVVKLQAEDIKALKALPGFEGVVGLPAFLVFGEAEKGE